MSRDLKRTGAGRRAVAPSDLLPDLAAPLLAWYARHQRHLPWRGARDPYAIWVSEIMLQQTQVETVRPYYARWLAAFPTLAALAAAPPAAVLAVWEGLGYYSRARNLHRAAQQVAAEHGGALPRTVAGLRALPGIGRYTAGAIASMAFGVDAAVLDGNVKRVLARVFDLTVDVKSPAGEKQLWALAERLLPPGRAGDYNQALMDLGATLCLPRAPLCLLCPLRELCAAFANGTQHLRPVLPARRAQPERRQAAGVIRKGGRVLLAQRPADGLLGGLWAFPAVDVPAEASADEQAAALSELLRKEYGLTVTLGETPGPVLRHTFTHFRLVLHVYEGRWRAGRLAAGQAARRWVKVSELGDCAMGKTDRRVAQGLTGE
ncbi:MAG: A/G-specific adenine glycosylase [Anaerolineales bacterium]|nr:A/G-specific adenine glycosylase [Anaerolineales bacterium]